MKYGTMTVAIPTYRRYSGFLENYLPKYLNMPEIDTILIGDETGEDIEQIKKQPWGTSEKFVFIQNPERLGAYHNKLNLLKQVKTDWVALIDSDNELIPEYFSGLYSYWELNGTDYKSVYIA
jgi:glycosyltransferase involved in cell wall biosynthesis